MLDWPIFANWWEGDVGCGCGKTKKSERFKVTTSDGKTLTFTSEADAKLTVAKKGGSYRKVA
jgi:hypothetical protein